MKNIRILFIMSLAFTSFNAYEAHADARSTIDDDTAALNELMSNPSESIPADLMHAAKCVASLHMVKVGFFWGGRIGNGVVSCRDSDKNWSAPVFVQLGSASVGRQNGIGGVGLTRGFASHGAKE